MQMIATILQLGFLWVTKVLHFWVTNWNCSEEKVMTMLADVQMKLVENGKTSDLAFTNYSNLLAISKIRFLFVPFLFGHIFDLFSMLTSSDS